MEGVEEVEEVEGGIAPPQGAAGRLELARQEEKIRNVKGLLILRQMLMRR